MKIQVGNSEVKRNEINHKIDTKKNQVNRLNTNIAHAKTNIELKKKTQ